MTWSSQQDAALGSVRKWLADRHGPQIFRLFGYAGTGKTTLAKELASGVKGKVLYATFTGKAALVLRSKGCKDASTIHSLIYEVETDPVTGKASFTLAHHTSNLTGAKLLIVDEVSMVGEALARDLLSFGVRILVLGDPAQLPPVKDEGFFINAQPDVMLTEVHRQAADSPIIRMSMDVREGRKLQPGDYGDCRVMKDADRDVVAAKVMAADQVLCGLNRTRVSYNHRMRAMKGLCGTRAPWLPTAGDRLICLRNRQDRALFNGSMWEALEVRDSDAKLAIVAKSEDEQRDPLTLEVFDAFFNGTDHELDWQAKRGTDEVTFGWTITCHKSQGSQWNNMVVFDESGAFREFRRNWLYTAITRAAEKLTVVQ